MQPILAVHITGDDEGGNIVTGGVDHGGRGVNQLTDSQSDGEGDGHVLGEEHGAENQLAGTAAAGDAAHCNGGEHRHDDCQNCLTGAEVHAEHAEEEGHLDDGAHGRTVHVHGGAQRQNNVSDIGGDAGLLRNLHVGGDGCNGGAGAKGGCCRAEQVAEHELCCALAAAEPGVDGGGDKEVRKGNDVVHDDGSCVVGDKVCAVGSDQRGEEAEEADGCVVGDYLDHVHQYAVHVSQQLCSHGLGAACHLHAKAEEHACNDKGQDGPAAEQLKEVGLGEEVYNQGGNVHAGYLVGCFKAGSNGVNGDEAHDDVHDDCGDGCGNKEGGDGHAHDPAGLFCGIHVCDGGGDGAEDHGHHHAEHQVSKNGSKGCKHSGIGPDKAHDTAQHDTQYHGAQEPVVLKKLHKKLLLSKDRLRYHYICKHLPSKL